MSIPEDVSRYKVVKLKEEPHLWLKFVLRAKVSGSLRTDILNKQINSLDLHVREC